MSNFNKDDLWHMYFLLEMNGNNIQSELEDDWCETRFKELKQNNKTLKKISKKLNIQDRYREIKVEEPIEDHD